MIGKVRVRTVNGKTCEDCGEWTPLRRTRCKLCKKLVCRWCYNHVHGASFSHARPDIASVEVEELMEEKGLPEEERDEVRRFIEFLKRRKDKREGKELPPAPKGMRE